jgi:hypothetical protein
MSLTVNRIRNEYEEAGWVVHDVEIEDGMQHDTYKVAGLLIEQPDGYDY